MAILEGISKAAKMCELQGSGEGRGAFFNGLSTFFRCFDAVFRAQRVSTWARLVRAFAETERAIVGERIRAGLRHCKSQRECG